MSVTAKELAKLLGLSESAVSLALNDRKGVSTATKKRVIEAAKEHGYDFSRITVEPPQQQNGNICLVIYKKHGAVVADTPFFAELFEGVDMECKRSPYFLNVRYMHDDDNVFKCVEEWKTIGCKGIILLGTEMQQQDILPYLNCGLPTVLLDSYSCDVDIDCVLINNVTGAYDATNYLIRKRGTQPGYLRSSYPINNFEERADGFYKAIRKNGMSSSRSVVHLLTPSLDGAYADMKDLIEAGEPLASCYFADNDLIAAGAIKAFKEAGYRIPQDIAVVGFDNMPICNYTDPPLTTVHVPKHYMGQMAVERLTRMIESPDGCAVKIEIATSLQKRKSC